MSISKFTLAAALAAGLISAAPAVAQEEPSDGFTVSGSVTGVSQYRFRGISLSDEEATIQGGLTVSHDSGFYVGAWGSGLAGFGSFGGSNTEVDVYGGYTTEINGLTLDVGLLWYLYPGTNGTDIAEPYASIKGTVGPVTAKLGVAYAPEQDALGGEDNLYVYTDLVAAIPDSPVSLRAHLGRSFGDSALTLGGDNYWDYSVGADITWKNLTFGLTYVDTDLKESVYGPFHDQVDSAVVFSIGAAF